MLYHYISPWLHEIGGVSLFRYITFRSFSAFLVALCLSIIGGQYFIKMMKKKQFGQVIRQEGPESHFKKAGTPTMGGVFILGSVFCSILLFGNFSSLPFLVTCGVMLSYFALGYLDDYLKVLKKNTKGVSGKMKLLWQFVTAFIAAYILIHYKVISTELYFPFIKGPIIDLGFFYMPFIAFVVVGSSNAVNLTDGLDGLAIGPIVTSAMSLGLLAYVAGRYDLASYLFIPYVGHAGEISVLASAIIGAGVGFLWYNSYPAQVFMGDVGSLSLGGTLGMMAVVTKNEFLFCLIGGIFVLEALSVIIQVASFKTRGKRVFKMAPIHHHFELKGWPEPKVIVRFWIISIALAIIGIASLKIR